MEYTIKITEDDIQGVSRMSEGRELNQEELEEVFHYLPKCFDWERNVMDIIAYVVKELK